MRATLAAALTFVALLAVAPDAQATVTCQTCYDTCYDTCSSYESCSGHTTYYQCNPHDCNPHQCNCQDCQTCYQTCCSQYCTGIDGCGAEYTYCCGTQTQCNPYACNCVTHVDDPPPVLYPTVPNTTPTVGGGGNSESIACGSTSSYWNAPKGAVVASVAPGIVSGVVYSLGEFRTHVALSHGASENSWVSHNSMVTPSKKLECDEVVDGNELANGVPGGARIPVRAMYNFYNADPKSKAAFMYYQTTGVYNDPVKGPVNIGEKIADFFNIAPGDTYDATNLGCVNVAEKWSAKGGSSYRYYVYLWPSDEDAQHANKFISYRVNEYVNGENGNRNMAGTCSNFLAYLQKKAMGSGWEPTVQNYAPAEVSKATIDLWNNINTDCRANQKWWMLGLSGLYCRFACGTIFSNGDDMCERAATQVAYCFTSDVWSDNCKNGCHSASDVKSKPVAAAKSISPDRLMGYHGADPTTTTKSWLNPATGQWEGPGTDCNAPNSGKSAWACDVQKTVTWASPGNIYTCWF
jgi:hypothetical protein